MPVDERDEDTDLGLPRKLGWTIALWALALLQLIIIALQGFLVSATVDQGRRIARIEGRLGIAADASTGMKYALNWDTLGVIGPNHFDPVWKEIP